MRPRPRRSSNAARPSSASGGCAIALSPTASRKPATACSPSHGCRQVSGEAREQRTRSSVCTKSSSGGSRRRPCCRRQKQQRCCSGRCSPLVRSICARLMVGRRSPQSPSISRLTSPPDRILSKCRRSRHRIPTPLATPPTELAFAREVGCRPRSLLGWKASTVNHTTAIFRQINKDDPRTHHDALEFPDGQIVLLTDLFEDQEATVLQLPAQPATAAEAAAQERVALVG